MPCDNVNEIRFRDTDSVSSTSPVLSLFSIACLVQAQIYKWILSLFHIYFVIMKLIVNLQLSFSFLLLFVPALDFELTMLFSFYIYFFFFSLALFLYLKYFALNQFQTSFILLRHTITHCHWPPTLASQMNIRAFIHQPHQQQTPPKKKMR